MVIAAHQQDYSGTFVYQSGARVEVSRITHVSDQNGEHERLEGLGGSHREIIRNNDQVWLYLGDYKVRVEKRRTEHAFPALLPDQISSLNDNYVIRHGEEDQVAGFHAHTIVFQSKDNLRYCHKMWADSASGLLLKAAVLDEHGQVIEQYAFTQLTIGKDVDKDLLVPSKSSATYLAQKLNLAPLPKIEALPDTDGWKVDTLPAGFYKVMAIRRPLREKSKPVTHLIFSDGLVGISVFIEDRVENLKMNSGLSSQGAMQIYSKPLGDYLITVVGEVPPKTLIQVAESVRFAGQ
jgi:sigma-E factor negative regulatory protein RseB